jgi:hypothetical protein
MGDPLIATVQLKNETPADIVVPKFGVGPLKFMYGKKGLNARIQRDPVHSPSVPPRPRRIKPGAALTRQFLFTRITMEAGEHVLFVSFKGATGKGEFIEETAFSVPVPYRVTAQVGLKRDKVSGLILKAQAVELAKAQATGRVTFARPVLVEIEKSGLYTWVVMLTEQHPKAGERKYAVRVDAYSGKVAPLELKGQPKPAIAVESKALGDLRKKVQSAPVTIKPKSAPHSGSAGTSTREGSAGRGGL